MLPLERPVLSLTIDAVAKMSGEDALCGLLTLFHKCKDGLQDGDRLENMAWRLWHVERASSQEDFLASAALSSPGLVASPLTSSSSTCSEGSSEVSSDGETCDQDQTTTLYEYSGASNDKQSYAALSNTLTPIPHAPLRDGLPPLKRERSKRRSPSPTSASSRTVSPNRRPSLSCRRTHSNTSVGQIMADLLPEKLDLHRSASLNPLIEQRPNKAKAAVGPDSEEQVPAVVVMPAIPVEQPQAQPSPPPSTVLDQFARFPTVVIVNPTPHPTPPMTPQVSSPPTSPATSSDVSVMPRRDTLTVVTNVYTPMSPTFPPTPESIGEDSVAEQPPSSVPETRPSLLPPGSGLGSGNNRSKGGSDGKELKTTTGKSAAVNDTSNVLRLGSALPSSRPGPSGSSLNPPERKFFISQAGSPDGDSPDTSASSQVGSQSGISMSVVPSTIVDKKSEGPVEACEPASVASRSSALTARSHSSNGSSSRGSGTRMKSRKSATTSATVKGKAKEKCPPGMHRTQSSNRIHRLQTGPGGLTSGTIQRSKLGGRTAAASTHTSALVASQFARQPTARPPPTSGAPLQPPPPAPVSRLARVEKSAGTSSTESRPESAVRRSASSRRSSKSGSSAKGLKPSGNALPSSHRRLDIADDSDYSTESEWDTEDVSEEADRTSGENEQMIADRKLAEAAAEAQRQRDLFAKVDRRSYSDLTRVRTQPGLLSAIFHPDPQLFPPDHPYRHSRSTQDILAHVNRPAYQPSPLQSSKSSAAVPVAATVTAHSVGTLTENHGRQRSPLRLKGRPQDVEESESGEEDDNKLHVSESVAEKRLAMLQRQNTKGPRPQEPSRLAQQALAARQGQQSNVYSASSQALGGRPGPTPPLARVATEPIPLGYPYNLPPPMAPSTPRTTRRNMLTNELSESLRRNLLWERQISKQRPIGLGRRAVTSAAVPTAGPSALRTSTTAANINGQQNGNAPQQNGGAPSQQIAKDDQYGKLKSNRSWTDDYHVTGW